MATVIFEDISMNTASKDIQVIFFQKSKWGCMKQLLVLGLLPLPKSTTSHFAHFFFVTVINHRDSQA